MVGSGVTPFGVRSADERGFAILPFDTRTLRDWRLVGTYPIVCGSSAPKPAQRVSFALCSTNPDASAVRAEYRAGDRLLIGKGGLPFSDECLSRIMTIAIARRA